MVLGLVGVFFFLEAGDLFRFGDCILPTFPILFEFCPLDFLLVLIFWRFFSFGFLTNSHLST
jgi:hypothetical protein